MHYNLNNHHVGTAAKKKILLKPDFNVYEKSPKKVSSNNRRPVGMYYTLQLSIS